MPSLRQVVYAFVIALMVSSSLFTFGASAAPVLPLSGSSGPAATGVAPTPPPPPPPTRVPPTKPEAGRTIGTPISSLSSTVAPVPTGESAAPTQPVATKAPAQAQPAQATNTATSAPATQVPATATAAPPTQVPPTVTATLPLVFTPTAVHRQWASWCDNEALGGRWLRMECVVELVDESNGDRYSCVGVETPPQRFWPSDMPAPYIPICAERGGAIAYAKPWGRPAATSTPIPPTFTLTPTPSPAPPTATVTRTIVPFTLTPTVVAPTTTATPTTVIPLGGTSTPTPTSTTVLPGGGTSTPTPTPTTVLPGGGTSTPTPTPTTILPGDNTATPTPTPTTVLPGGGTSTPTPTPTTVLPGGGTSTPTPTSTTVLPGDNTATPTPTPTTVLPGDNTATPTPTSTPLGTETPTPTASPTLTETATPTATPICIYPTPTNTPIGGPTPTNTPIGAASPTPTPTCYAPPATTQTPTTTATPTTVVPTAVLPDLQTATPVPTRTMTPTPTRTPTSGGGSSNETPIPPTATTPPSEGGAQPGVTPTAVLGVSSGPPSEICVANLTVTVFHDQNGNGVFDQGEQTLPGWTIEVNGTRGGRITTGENGTAWIGDLNNGETYVVRLVFPPESGWFPTTRSSITWEAVCGEVEFGITRFTLPTTGGDLRTNTGAPADSLRTPLNHTPVKQEGLLSLPGLSIPLQPTSVEGRELLVPEWAGGVTHSPAGGLRINWHAGQFMLAHPPKVGDTVSVTYAGETTRYRVDLVTVAPADAESTPLQTAPRGSLLLVTCTGPEWSSRLLVWASQVE